MRTAGRVGVGRGAGVDVAVGVTKAVRLGDGVTVGGTGAEMQAAIKKASNRMLLFFIFCLHKERLHFEAFC